MDNNKLAVLCKKTQEYLDSLDRQNLPTPAQIADDIIGIIATAYALRNAGMMNNKDNKWHIPDTLEPVQIAMILTALYPIKNISCLGDSSETDYDLLGIYQEDGPEKGIYSTSDRAFSRLCRQLHPGLTKQQLEEVRSQVSDRVARVPRCLERNLVPVNNGIFNFDTKQLLPFTPDKVFLTKCRVDYVPNAVSPVIHNQDDGTDWELETWMKELSDDPGVPELFWEIMGAIIRPNVRWNKSAWFYNDRGENGKGTLCALMRNLCGHGNHAGIKLDDFSKENPKTLHALTGSLVARRIFGENDAVVAAIASHTTGKADMNVLEKIIYVADYMEPNRDFEGVQTLRSLAYSDLDGALELGLNMTLGMLRQQGREISGASLDALAWLEKIKNSPLKG